MNSFIKLGFIGSYKLDLLQYFAKFLVEMEKRVVIADASSEQYLAINLREKAELEKECQGICYITGCNSIEKLDKLKQKETDVILVDYGMDIEMAKDYQECDILFIVCDFEKYNVMRILDISSCLNPNSKIVKIYKDIISTKINKRYIDYILKLEDKSKVLAEYVLEFNERDYKARLLCQYDDNFSLKYISKAYRNLFFDISEELFQINTKEVNRKLKRAEGLRV